MFTGKFIAIAVALMLTLAGAAGYFVMKMQADDALERAKIDDDARYQAQRKADIKAGREAVKHPAFITQSPEK
ncbi:MAG: hypothetical protein IPK66_18920 [Rhodospirillales bacterium]|nr:hypothetical protein [Rhodospirillales bacterium]